MSRENYVKSVLMEIFESDYLYIIFGPGDAGHVLARENT